MKQPFCRCCGKPIRKRTRLVYIETKASDQRYDGSFIRYAVVAPDARPRTKADCQRLTNQQVVAVQRDDTKEFIRLFHEWDGESYQDDLFCTGTCAQAFGRAAALKGFATDKYARAKSGGSKEKQ